MIIGISGKMNAGKNTVGNLIAEIHHSKPVYLVSFAGLLKQICALMLDVPLETMEDRSFKNTKLAECFGNKTVRELMQFIGNSFRHGLSDNIWIDYLLNKIHDDNNTIYVITDVRFKNEYNAILKRGGEVIRVVRPDTDSDMDESEVDLDDVKFSYVVRNNCDMKTLKVKVRKVVRTILDVHNIH